MILLLLKDDLLRQKLSRQAQSDAREIYSWDKIVKRLKSVYEMIVTEAKKMEWFSAL